jgi:tRNA A-37 threonylcarbamoyl transferase component Bud32
MRDVKDTARALVRISYDGRVFKTFRGPKAEERYANEVKVLRYLEERGCPFVPRLIEADDAQLRIVTSNCGARVEHLDEARVRELFAELEAFGVRHDDADMRNVTYRQQDGRFCLIDFEFATILPESGVNPPPAQPASLIPTDKSPDGAAQ